MMKLLSPNRGQESSRNDPSFIHKDDLRAYEKACEDDPYLQRFDLDLRRRTKRTVDSLAARPEDRPLSFGSLTEVAIFILTTIQELAKLVREIKEETRNDKESWSLLVNSYLERSSKTLDFCNAVEEETKRVKISQMIIRYASKQFEKEVNGKSSGGRALKELKKLKAAGKPFGDFLRMLEFVYDQQVSLLEELHQHKHKLDNDLNEVRAWRRVSNVVFATASTSVLILSIVGAASTSAAVPRAVAEVLSETGPTVRWCSDSWKEFEEAVKGKKRTGKLKEIGSRFTVINGIECMDAIIEKMGSVEDEAGEVRQWMAATKEEFDEFMERVKELDQTAAKCAQEIVSTRSVVAEHLLKYT